MSTKSPLTSNHVEVVVRRSERCPGAEGSHLDGSAACGEGRRLPKAGVRVPVLVCVFVVVAYIAAGGLIFHHMEGWTILEGSYFSFAILGTIGFGDLVPGRSARLQPAMTPKWKSEIPCVVTASLYILFGMALVAMSFSLVQDDFVKVLRSLSRTCSRHASADSSRAELEPS